MASMSNQPFQGKVFGLTGNMDREVVMAQIKKGGGQVRGRKHCVSPFERMFPAD